jgi:1-aminocyclopropane-1-carboxylate deaminase/D-cysteine desulfhydrase-like pyridoxal-dependent ACC family enzyme
LEEIKLNLPTPIDTIMVDGISFFLKRDDLIHPDFSGNKARKLHYYLQKDLSHIKQLTSYGSNQSNAMYSMSVLAKINGWDFEYYTDHISDFLKKNPHGNYAKALENGMKILCRCEAFEKNGLPQSFGLRNDKSVLFVNEGGRDKEASFGLEIMAKEIVDWCCENSMENLNIFLPSGTGTTALFLQKHCRLLTLGQSIRIIIYTTPCVGNSDYLRSQFLELESNSIYHPIILEPQKKYHFGKLYKEHYNFWLKLRKQTGIEFDLLYDPLGWNVMLDNLDILGKNKLYIHQGGLLGNESMLMRYKRRFKDSNEDN